MNSWRPYPLLRLLFPFVAGIIAEVAFGSTDDHKTRQFALLFLLMAMSPVLAAMISSYRLRWITGLVITFFLFLAGYETARCHRPANDPDFLGKNPGGLFVIAIAEPPVRVSSGLKVVGSVRFRIDDGKWIRASGNAICYLKLKPGGVPPQFGDHVLLGSEFGEISDNSNPHTFNYARYLKNKGIMHRVYAESWAWQLIDLPYAGLIRKLAFQVRDNLLNILRNNHVEGREFAVAAALLLGYVDELDAGLRNDYAATGAMHILSVSGMHVGIIYIFLEFLLGFLNKTKSGRMVKAILLLVFIWFYALVTGLSPCVLRSAAMLSLPIIGKSMNRSPDMYNIIAASMIFILVTDPFLILDVGFQLSYLAVAGIVLLYKPIYDLYITSSWLPDKIWSIAAVSIAAQIATLPITLYTFHQFPNYFMLTNVFVVPLSSLAIYCGILALVVGNLPVVSAICAKCLVLLVWSLNSVIHFIEQLPFSTIRGIYISAPEMVVLYTAIIMGFLFLTQRRIAFLFAFLITAIVMNLLILEFRIERLRSSRMVIFNVAREALYMFSTQDKAVLLYNRTARNGSAVWRPNYTTAQAEMEAAGIQYHRDFWMQMNNRKADFAGSFVPVIRMGRFILFKEKPMVILNTAVPKGFKRKINAEILVLTGNAKINLSDAIRIFQPLHIVIDATNSRYKTLQWMKEAAREGIQCQAVSEHGAFQKEF